MDGTVRQLVGFCFLKRPLLRTATSAAAGIKCYIFLSTASQIRAAPRTRAILRLREGAGFPEGPRPGQVSNHSLSSDHVLPEPEARRSYGTALPSKEMGWQTLSSSSSGPRLGGSWGRQPGVIDSMTTGFGNPTDWGSRSLRLSFLTCKSRQYY